MNVSDKIHYFTLGIFGGLVLAALYVDSKGAGAVAQDLRMGALLCVVVGGLNLIVERMLSARKSEANG